MVLSFENNSRVSQQAALGAEVDEKGLPIDPIEAMAGLDEAEQVLIQASLDQPLISEAAVRATLPADNLRVVKR